MPGCGKEEFLKVAAEQGFTVIRMGDTVREEAARRGVGASDDAIGGVAHSPREEKGDGGWAGRTIPPDKGGRGVIDSLRRSKELEAVPKALGGARQVVAGHSPPPGRGAR